MNEIFSNQLLQLCLICEIAVKTLYLMANNGREQLMGTGDGYCVPYLKLAFQTKQTDSPVPWLGRMTKWPNDRTEWPNDRIGLFGVVPSLMLKGQFLNIIKIMGDIDWDLTIYRFLDMLNPNLTCKFLSAHSFLLFQKSHSHLGNSSPNCPGYHIYWLKVCWAFWF